MNKVAATSSTLYPSNSTIHIARHLRSLLYGRGITSFMYSNTRVYLTGLSRALLRFFPTTFLEIAVYVYNVLHTGILYTACCVERITLFGG